MSKRQWLAFGAAVFFLTYCTTVSVEKNRIAHIKKIAIVGFTVSQQVPDTTVLRISSGSRNTNLPEWTGSIGKESQHANEMYLLLQKKLKTELKWTALDRSDIAKNKFYEALYQKKMKGWQNRPGGAAGMVAYGAGGIIDAWPMEQLKATDRDELMEALKVDAIVTVTMRINLESGGGLKNLVGAGDYLPFATSSLAVFEKKGATPIWRDYAARGKVVSEGVSHVLGIANTDALNAKAVVAAENSYQKLIENFRSL